MAWLIGEAALIDGVFSTRNLDLDSLAVYLVQVKGVFVVVKHKLVLTDV